MAGLHRQQNCRRGRRALAELRSLSDARVEATGRALGEVRAKLREEIADAVGSLRADLTVEKAHASAG